MKKPTLFSDPVGNLALHAHGRIRSGPVQVLSVALGAVMADSDGRFGLSDVSQIGQVTVEDLKTVVAPQLANGALSLGLVGDFDPEAAIAQVAATLGALPPARFAERHRIMPRQLLLLRIAPQGC